MVNLNEDMIYSAAVKEAGINYRLIDELKKQGIITSHRQLLSGSVLDSIDLLPCSDRTKSHLLLLRQKQKDVLKLANDYALRADKTGVGVISVDDSSYPSIWKELKGMPPVIYYKGNLDFLSSVDWHGSVSMVGSREASAYALYATREFAEYFSARQVAVISGLALGVDRNAHLGAVDEKGGTIAVVAGGADIIYPFDNKDIYQKICSKGLIISEMPPGTNIIRQYFPSRNRLISALSDCCLVMEAGAFSGTLHTASFAAAQGREVFALPGNIFNDNNIGGLRLIRDGANVLIDPEDVLYEVAEKVFYRIGNYNSLPSRTKSKKRTEDIRILLRENHSKVKIEDLKLVIKEELSIHSMSLDMLAISLSVPFNVVSRAVSEMEIDGEIESRSGKFFLTF